MYKVECAYECVCVCVFVTDKLSIVTVYPTYDTYSE